MLLASPVRHNILFADMHRSHAPPLLADSITDAWPHMAEVDVTNEMVNRRCLKSGQSWYQKSSEASALTQSCLILHATCRTTPSYVHLDFTGCVKFAGSCLVPFTPA